MVTAEAIARALASGEMATAIESAIERMQVEEIYSLGGGELEDAPLPYTDENGRAWAFRYHFDGVPEWCASDFKPHDGGQVDFFTAIRIDDPCGWSPEEVTLADGKRYFRIAVLGPAGERECPMGPSGWGEKTVGAGTATEDPDGFISCPYCEAKEGEEHGYIYLGTGSEVVYKHVDVECHGCGCTRIDAANPEGGDVFACYCAEQCPQCMDERTNVSEEYRPGTWICHNCGHSWPYVAPPPLPVQS